MGVFDEENMGFHYLSVRWKNCGHLVTLRFPLENKTNEIIMQNNLNEATEMFAISREFHITEDVELSINFNLLLLLPFSASSSSSPPLATSRC